MDRDAAVLTIGRRLGNRTDLDARIVILMDLAQQGLEQGEFLPWFLETEASLSNQVSPNLDHILVPSDFIAELEGTDFREYAAGDTSGRPLTKTDLQEITRAQELGYFTTTGNPEFYALVGNIFRLGIRTPSLVQTYKFWYLKRDVLPGTLLGTGTNLWLTEAAEVLISETGLLIAAEVRDQDALGIFQTLLHGTDGGSGAYERLRLTHEARQHAGREYRMDTY